MSQKTRQVLAAGFLFIILMNGAAEFSAAAGFQILVRESVADRGGAVPHTGDQETRGQRLALMKQDQSLAAEETDVPLCHRGAALEKKGPSHCSDCGAVCTMGAGCDCASMRRQSGRPDGVIFTAPGCGKDATGKSLPLYPSSIDYLFGFAAISEAPVSRVGFIRGSQSLKQPSDYRVGPPTPPPKQTFLQ